MTAHIVLPPRQVPHSASWWAECTCGETVVGQTADDVRDQCRPHRAAQREHAGQLYDAQRAAIRQHRRAARRAQNRSRHIRRGSA
jgi:hypothetical protein